MAIYLIRHGETPGNAARVVQTPDTPLSPRGIDQAERLARRLAGEGIAQVLASDLRRAAMTAAPLAAATGAPIEYAPILQERNFGDVRGTPYAELGFDLFAPAYVPPGGEGWEAFHARVDAAWLLICAAAAAAPGHLAVVTHGLVCHSLALRHLPGERAPAPVPNTALTIVDPTPPLRVWLRNCTSHLDDEFEGDDPGIA